MLVCDLSKMEMKVITGLKSKDVYSIHWLDQSHLLYCLVSDKMYAEGLFVAEVSHLSDTYAVESFSATSLVGVPKGSPLKPLIWIERNAYDEGNDSGVVQIDTSKRLGRNRDAIAGTLQAMGSRDETDLYGMRASIIRDYPKPPGHGVVYDYLADKDGQLAFAITVDKGFYTLFRLAGKEWVKCPVDLDLVYPVGAGDVPNELIVVGPPQEGKPRALQRLNASTGALGEVLLQDKIYDMTACALYRQPVTGTVLGVRFSRSLPVTVWFDENYHTIQKLLEKQFPREIVQILGSDDEENSFFVAVYSDRQPVAYHLFNLKTRALTQIKSTAPWIDPTRLQAANVMKFKTRDGHMLEAYVTLPAGSSKKTPAPLVVLPHGGPWVRDTWGFDPEVQFLASRGYAVLQPNYRGSPGYDWMFPLADQWEFRKMHDDVTDAVKALVGTGLVDPKRMAIMGTSFGGYLAACGAAFEPDMYRCAVAISGVFDWEQVIRESKYDQFTTPEFGVLRRNLGDPAAKRGQFDAVSPLRHIDRVRIPFFVAHGEDDHIASVSESRALIRELKKFNVPYEAMLVSGEGHGMLYLKNEVELYSRVEAFLAKNL